MNRFVAADRDFSALEQNMEFQSSIWASCRQAVEKSFALLSRGSKQGANEPY